MMVSYQGFMNPRCLAMLSYPALGITFEIWFTLITLSLEKQIW